MGFLAFRAYRDGMFPPFFYLHPALRNAETNCLRIGMIADGLDRFEVPFFGGLASSFVDSE